VRGCCRRCYETISGAGPLAPSGNAGSGAALLASWTPPAGTRAAFRNPERHALAITPPP